MRAILVANTQKHYNATISYASLTTDSEPIVKSLYIYWHIAKLRVIVSESILGNLIR